MTWQQIEGNRRQFAGNMKAWCGQLTDHDWAPTVIDKTILAPLRLVHVAKRLAKARTTVAQNAEGEILVFHQRMLVFGKRQVCCRYFASKTIVTPLARKAPVELSIREVRETMCGTSLGDAFVAGTARSAGPAQHDGRAIDTGVFSEDGALSSYPSSKIARLRRILKDKPYARDLDTALRQRIEALDGATVLTIDGDVLAARAIQLIRSSDSSNGHRGAQEACGDSNIRIKMHHDGYLQIFARENEGPLVSFG